MENRFWQDQHRVKLKKGLSDLVQGNQENSVLIPELWPIEEWCSIVSVMWYSLGYEIFKESSQLKDASCLFPDGSSGKESTCNAEDPGLNPGLGRSSGEGNGYPAQYSCLENLMDRGTLWVTVHGSQRVRRNWATNTSTFTGICKSYNLSEIVSPLNFGILFNRNDYF